MPRTFLAHLNLTLPDNAPAATDNEARERLLDELQGALTLGHEGCPDTLLLARCTDVTVVDGEEI